MNGSDSPKNSPSISFDDKLKTITTLPSPLPSHPSIPLTRRDCYDLCLSHLEDAADELKALRQENADLRIAKNDLGIAWNEEESPKDENVVLKAVESVHAMIDKEVAAGINPENIYVDLAKEVL